MRCARRSTARLRGGWLAVEWMTAIVLLGMVLAGALGALYVTGRLNRHHFVRQRCIAAGQAQLDSLSADGRALGDDDFRRLWPKLTCRIERQAGQGDWAGLTLCKVTVSGTSSGRPISVTLARYVPPGKDRP